jgi:zinc transport system ATP-binding protein
VSIQPPGTASPQRAPNGLRSASSGPPALPETALTVSHLGVVLEGRTVLQDISFTLRRGTTLAIVGPNGAGKTVLLRSLLGLVPHTGTVSWAPTVKIGLVPQNFAVTDVPITVREFLSLNRTRDYRDCLAVCGLEKGRILDERLGTLSGGELQRVLIAWALVDDPNVLVVDEPTAHIDVGAEDLILETLNRIEKERGMSILLVSHDIHNVMAYSDTALALNGSVIYSGPSRGLSDPNLLIRIFGSGTILAEHRHGEGSV